MFASEDFDVYEGSFELIRLPQLRKQCENWRRATSGNYQDKQLSTIPVMKGEPSISTIKRNLPSASNGSTNSKRMKIQRSSGKSSEKWDPEETPPNSHSPGPSVKAEACTHMPSMLSIPNIEKLSLPNQIILKRLALGVDESNADKLDQAASEMSCFGLSQSAFRLMMMHCASHEHVYQEYSTSVITKPLLKLFLLAKTSEEYKTFLYLVDVRVYHLRTQGFHAKHQGVAGQTLNYLLGAYAYLKQSQGSAGLAQFRRSCGVSSEPERIIRAVFSAIRQLYGDHIPYQLTAVSILAKCLPDVIAMDSDTELQRPRSDDMLGKYGLQEECFPALIDFATSFHREDIHLCIHFLKFALTCLQHYLRTWVNQKQEALADAIDRHYALEDALFSLCVAEWADRPPSAEVMPAFTKSSIHSKEIYSVIISLLLHPESYVRSTPIRSRPAPVWLAMINDATKQAQIMLLSDPEVLFATFLRRHADILTDKDDVIYARDYDESRGIGICRRYNINVLDEASVLLEQLPTGLTLLLPDVPPQHEGSVSCPRLDLTVDLQQGLHPPMKEVPESLRNLASEPQVKETHRSRTVSSLSESTDQISSNLTRPVSVLRSSISSSVRDSWDELVAYARKRRSTRSNASSLGKYISRAYNEYEEMYMTDDPFARAFKSLSMQEAGQVPELSKLDEVHEEETDPINQPEVSRSEMGSATDQQPLASGRPLRNASRLRVLNMSWSKGGKNYQSVPSQLTISDPIMVRSTYEHYSLARDLIT